jgi:hypothetical protein
MKPVELQPGERLLWTGKPARLPIFRAEDKLFVPGSVLWCAVVAWLFFVNPDTAPPPVFVLVPFVILGGWALFGRLIVRQLVLRGTRYSVTGKRVVAVVTVLGFRRERSVYHRDLKRPKVTNEADGIGTVVFGDKTYFDLLVGKSMNSNDRPNKRAPKRPLELLHIDHPVQVRDLIAAARAGKTVG